MLFVILPLPRSACTVPEAACRLLQWLLLEPSGATNSPLAMHQLIDDKCKFMLQLLREFTQVERCLLPLLPGLPDC